MFIGVDSFKNIYFLGCDKMLDKYKDGQPILYQLTQNIIKNNKISHAYLFEKNNNEDASDIILSFVKALLCPNSKLNCSSEVCNICKRIDDGNYPEIKIINPDGMWIKKDQMIDLQKEFSKKKVEGLYRIYIINDCEKLNKYASNSILKFLEEPADDIIAILVTNNINLIMDTIISRCQIISLIPKKDNLEIYDDKIMENVINFIDYVEKNNTKTIIYLKDLWHNKFKDKNDCIMAFKYIIYIYKECVNLKNGLEIKDNVIKYEKIIKEIAVNNKMDELLHKMDIFIKYSDLIKYNLNMNMLMDKIIIEVGEI